MFKFLHAADLHLDSPLVGLQRYDGAPVDDIRQASRRALENLVRAAIDHQVVFVVIAGDVYDGDWRDHNTGLFFVQQMVRLREAGIRVFLIAGNHDAANRMTKSLSLPDNVHMFDHAAASTMRLDDFDVAIHGQSFGRREVFDNLAAAYPRAEPGCFNLGLLHTSATGFEGHDSYAPCNLSDLHAQEYDYWALGHIHQRQALHAEKDKPVHFAGNLQGRHIRETGAKGCLLVQVDRRQQAEVQFVPLDVFRWEQLTINATPPDTSDDLLAKLDAELTRRWEEHGRMPCAIRVHVRGATRSHSSLVERPENFTAQVQATALQVADGRVWVERVKLQTHAEQVLDPDGPLGELTAYLAELRDDEAAASRLASEVDDFMNKLPPEIRERDGLRLDDPQRLRALLAEVEPLLIARLSAAAAPG